MNQDKSFQQAVIISLILHVIILTPLALLDILNIDLKDIDLTNLEVTYLKIKPETIAIKKENKETPLDDLERIKSSHKVVLSEKDAIPDKIMQARIKAEQEELLLKDKQSYLKPVMAKTSLLPKHEITISPMETSKALNPAYLGYQNFTRETFRRYLLSKYSDIPERGEVYLTFVVNADGAVTEAQVIDEKSSASENLKKVVLDSIFETSPFPPLPDTLDSPILSFSVTVHFQENNE